jgi:hypothetical protein
LQNVLLVSASTAFISVNGHDFTLEKRAFETSMVVRATGPAYAFDKNPLILLFLVPGKARRAKQSTGPRPTGRGQLA